MVCVGPDKWDIFFGELVEGLGDGREVGDEGAVVVEEAQNGTQGVEISGGGEGVDGINFGVMGSDA